MNDSEFRYAPPSFTFEVLALLFIQVLLLASASTAEAQNRPENPNVEREIHVQFTRGAVSLPPGRTQAPLQDIGVEAPGVQRAFQQFGVETVTKTFPRFEPADTIATARTGEKVRLPNLSQVFTLRLPSKAGIDKAVERLNELPQVIFAEPNGRATTLVLPNDEFFDAAGSPGSGGEQWSLLNTGQDGGTPDADIDAPEAWDITTGSSNTVIGIIDTGVNLNHPDLSGKASGSTVSSSHGTHVAGIAAAKTNNGGEGIAGVDWNAQIVSQPVGSDQVTSNSVLNAIQSGNADILNSSYILCNACNQPNQTPRFSVLVRRAYASAYRMNVISVAGMGNQGNDDRYYPAGFGVGMIAVGSTDRNDERASSSSFGSHIDVAAPGVAIRSSIAFGYGELSGTSMASPHVAGIAGLLLAENPGLYNDDVENIIRLSAEDVNDDTDPGFDENLGAGRVNARQALEYLQAPFSVKHWTANGGTSVDSWNFFGEFYDLPNALDGNYSGRVHRVRTTVSFPESFSSIVDVWGRGVASTGYSDATTNFSIPYCRVVSFSSRGVTLETFVYYISKTNTFNSNTEWYPATPSNTKCAYTVLGELGTAPLIASISGPDDRDSDESGTWSANADGGSGSVSYAWEYKNPGTSVWYSASGCSGKDCTLSFYNGSSGSQYGYLRVTINKGSETDQATFTVRVHPTDGGGCSDPRFCTASTYRPGLVQALEAAPSERGATLQWSALPSRSAPTFVVEHRTGGAAWSQIEGTEASTVSPDSTGHVTYQFKTKGLGVGDHEFRVGTSVGASDDLAYSEVVALPIRVDGAYEVLTYPNPARNQATVELAVREAQDVRVEVYDLLGRRVFDAFDGPVSGQQTRRIPLDLSRLRGASGAYFVRIVGESFSTTERLTVIR